MSKTFDASKTTLKIGGKPVVVGKDLKIEIKWEVAADAAIEEWHAIGEDKKEKEPDSGPESKEFMQELEKV